MTKEQIDAIPILPICFQFGSKAKTAFGHYELSASASGWSVRFFEYGPYGQIEIFLGLFQQAGEAEREANNDHRQRVINLLDL